MYVPIAALPVDEEREISLKKEHVGKTEQTMMMLAMYGICHLRHVGKKLA